MGSLDPGGRSYKFPSLAFRRTSAERECGQGADVTRTFLSSQPSPLWPWGPAGQLQLKAKLKASGVVPRWFPGPRSPPPPTPTGGQKGQEWVSPNHSNSRVTHSNGEETEACGRRASRQCSILSSCPSQGVKRISDSTDWVGPDQRPCTLSAPPREQCRAENVCLPGDKKP